MVVAFPLIIRVRAGISKYVERIVMRVIDITHNYPSLAPTGTLFAYLTLLDMEEAVTLLRRTASS